MGRMPRTTQRLSPNFLEGTFVRIITDEKERQALRTHTRSTDRPPTELETFRFAFGEFAECEHPPLICIGSRYTG